MKREIIDFYAGRGLPISMMIESRPKNATREQIESMAVRAYNEHKAGLLPVSLTAIWKYIKLCAVEQDSEEFIEEHRLIETAKNKINELKEINKHISKDRIHLIKVNEKLLKSRSKRNVAYKKAIGKVKDAIKAKDVEIANNLKKYNSDLSILGEYKDSIVASHKKEIALMLSNAESAYAHQVKKLYKIIDDKDRKYKILTALSIPCGMFTVILFMLLILELIT